MRRNQDFYLNIQFQQITKTYPLKHEKFNHIMAWIEGYPVVKGEAIDYQRSGNAPR